MKITKEWLKGKWACKEGFDWWEKNKEGFDWWGKNKEGFDWWGKNKEGFDWWKKRGSEGGINEKRKEIPRTAKIRAQSVENDNA
jgi:hypothetical protein